MSANPSIGKSEQPKSLPDEQRSSSPGQTGATGNPWKTRRRGGRRGNRSNPSSTSTPKQTTKFKGSCPDLEGHIFDIGPLQATLYTNTKKEIVAYASRTCSAEVGRAIQKIKDMKDAIPKPAEPDIEAGSALSYTQKRIIDTQVKTYCVAVARYEQDMKNMYSVVANQCTDEMLQQIEAQEEFDQIEGSFDVIGLMGMIKKICFNYRPEIFPPLSTIMALEAVLLTKQPDHMSNSDWFERFQNLVTAAEACGTSFLFPGVVEHVASARFPHLEYVDLSARDKAEIDKEVKDITLSTIYVHNANPGRYAGLRKKLQNDYLCGQSTYPTTLTAAQKLIVNFKGDGSTPNGRDNKRGADGIAFAQQDQPPSPKQQDRSNITCFRCGKKGHYSYDNVCKEADIKAFEAQKKKEADAQSTSGSTHVTNGTKTTAESTAAAETSEQLLHFGVFDTDSSHSDDEYQLMFCQPCYVTDADDTADVMEVPSINYDTVLGQAKGTIDKNWILLDNQSTVNVVCNPTLLSNIRQIPRHMHIHCNAGVTTTNWVGDYPGIGVVWYHADGIANILSLSKMKKTHRITYDSEDDNVFRLYSADRSSYRAFRESERGLYYSDIRLDRAIVLNNIETVEENKSKYSALDRKRADAARKLQDIVNVPTKALVRLLDAKRIPNCPVTSDDVKTADAIYGPSLIGLKGKTVRRPEQHVRVEIPSIPPEISSKYMKVHIGADIMVVNGVRFFVTISRHIQFATIEMISDATAPTLLSSIQQVQQTYSKRGFIITNINMDNQFVPIHTATAALGINVNFVARDEHVPEIERFIRTLKERTRGVQCTLPFKKYPAILTRGLVVSQLFWWNAVPKLTGVSDTLSPRLIVTGLDIDYNRHCRLQFGQYVQTHEETDNDTGHERTVGAIAMYPTGNRQGGYYFYSLKSGKSINRNRWTPLPMPLDVIDRVHHLSRRKTNGIVFADRNGIALPDHTEADDDPDDSTYNPDIDDDRTIVSDTSHFSDSTGVHDDDSRSIDNDSAATGVEQVGGEQTPQGDENNENEAPTDDHDGNAERSQYQLRTNRRRNYDHLKTVGYTNVITKADTWTPRKLDTYAHVVRALTEYNADTDPRIQQINEMILSQYGMKQGIKLYGQRGIDAVRKELQQFHDRGVAVPVNPESLTPEQRRRALAYLMFLKEKRCGTIKGRGCADGRKQRSWMDKQDTTSPTVSTHALFLLCMLIAKENRSVATSDIPGAFLQTDDDSGSTHLRFEGVMVDVLLEIDHDHYANYVQVDKTGKRYMYLECRKAIYGTLNAALLFWQKLSADLESWGFEPNPYDWCVMNKTIKGKQCTILWHVDDLLISHEDEDVITEALAKIDAVYGKESPITTTRGRVHDYLGMTIDFTKKGQVKFTMIDYVSNMLEEMPADMGNGESATPAGEHLFAVNETDPVLLSKQDRETFHQLTARLLYLSKRARPDIQLPVAFLCTRVQKADTDDWKKLGRVLKYLRSTVGLPLVLEMDQSMTMRWFVDAAFAVHNDMRSHTGMTMTMGRGAPMSNSSKQKLNTRSSTEAELVGVDDEMSLIMWCRYFLIKQGYQVNDNILYQDNQSAIKLEKNGKRSSGKRTRHIDIRYFFVTDRIAAGELSVEHCPTIDMIADYLTKPLQGKQFRTLRNAILGIDEVEIPGYNRNALKMIASKQQQIDNVLNEQSNTRDG